MNIPTVLINESDKREIGILVQDLKNYHLDFNSCVINSETLNIFRNRIFETAFYSKLLFNAEKFLIPNQDGFFVIDFDDFFESDFEQKTVVPIILSGIMHPFGVFKRHGLWKEIGVDLKKDPNRSSGIGYNSFHIDFVNTTSPPFYSILFCVKEDPSGGGQTIISNFHKAIKELSLFEIELLKDEIFEEGSFFDLCNVGTELKPFPVIQNSLGNEIIIRFTSRMNSKNKFDHLINKIEELLIKNQKTFLLFAGHLF